MKPNFETVTIEEIIENGYIVTINNGLVTDIRRG